jgi:hypothetical protein
MRWAALEIRAYWGINDFVGEFERKSGPKSERARQASGHLYLFYNCGHEGLFGGGEKELGDLTGALFPDSSSPRQPAPPSTV